MINLPMKFHDPRRMRSCVQLDEGETYRPIHRPDVEQNPEEIPNSIKFSPD